MRIHNFAKTLTEKEIEVVFLMQSTDIYYYTNTFANGILVITKNADAHLFVRRGLSRASQESNVQTHYMTSFLDVKNYLKQHNISTKTIGLELDVLPAQFYKKISQDFNESELVDVSNDIRWQRRIKDLQELENIEEAAKNLDCLMSDAKIYLAADKSEIEVSAKLEYFARLRGHQGQSRMRMFNGEIFFGHVLCGKSATQFSGYMKPLTGRGMYHTYPEGASRSRITKNTPIIVDFVFNYNGYLADETRTFVIGNLSKDLEKGFYCCKEIIEWFEDFAKAGVSVSEIYSKTVEMVKKAGHENIFMGAGNDRVNFIGHGLGLELDEHPFIAKGMDYPLEEQMVFAFEPKLVFNEGAVGLENTYLVKKDCLKSLTKFPLQLIKL